MLFLFFLYSLGPISAVGKKGKTGYLSARFDSLAVFFFSFFPQCGAWSQATFFGSDGKSGHKNLRYLVLKVNATWCSSRGGTSGNSWWGCAVRFSKSIPYFRPKNVIFQTRFQTRPLKPIPVFRPGL